MMRLVAFVTLKDGVDVVEPARRARAMLAEDPNVLDAEVGMGESAGGGRPPAASYVLTAVFADRAGFERYAAGEPHGAFFAWIDPYMEHCRPVIYELDTEG